MEVHLLFFPWRCWLVLFSKRSVPITNDFTAPLSAELLAYASHAIKILSPDTHLIICQAACLMASALLLVTFFAVATPVLQNCIVSSQAAQPLWHFALATMLLSGSTESLG